MSSLDKLAGQLVEKGGSDLHIAAGSPPMMRIDGDLLPCGEEQLTAEFKSENPLQAIPLRESTADSGQTRLPQNLTLLPSCIAESSS